MKSGKNLYIALILLLIGSFLCFSAWAAMRAAAAKPEVTDADYYSKGLKYTSTMLEKQAAVALGWQVATRIHNHTLQFRLSDRRGQAVVAATGSLSLYMADSASSVRLPLSEVVPGTYQLPLSAEMSGEISARLEFERDGVRLNRQLLLNL